MKLEKINMETLIDDLNNATAEEKSAKIIETIQMTVNESQKEIVERYQREFADVQANKANFEKYGLRSLNSEEKSFIDKLKEPKQLGSFTMAEQDELIPASITNYVFEDLKKDHPFLKYVTFTPAGVKKWLLSENQGKAKWGKLDAKIIEQITTNLSEIDIEINKLSAFAFLPKGLIDLGYEWIEKYIREVLLTITEDGLEEGFIAGNGKDAPIGLLQRLTGAVDGVYPARTAEVITDFSVSSLGQHFLTLTDNGKRKVGKVLMIVNPADAYTKVAEASTYLNAGGEFKKVFPFAIEIIESIHVPISRAILYIPFSYVGGITKQGVSYSDHYQFLDDNRVYKIVTYGNGRLVKENQAVLLDITNVKPLAFNVRTINEAVI